MLKNFWRKEYEENMILTATRRFSPLERLLSVMRASCKAVSEGESAQKQVEKRTSPRAWTMNSVTYSVVTHPFPIMTSTTRPVLSTCSGCTTGPMAARASSNTGFVDTLALMTTGVAGKMEVSLVTNRQALRGFPEFQSGRFTNIERPAKLKMAGNCN